MGTWIEDIVQALENLGGQAHRKQIIEEIIKIRKEPLPPSTESIVDRSLHAYSSDSAGFGGVDLFKKLGNGVWALRTYPSNPLTVRSNVDKTQTFNDPSFSDTYEEIAKILNTIKQYRDYHHPDSPSWKEYVDDIFHIMDFSLDQKQPRLKLVSVMGENQTPKAILVFITPHENFEELLPGVTWESYVLFAASYYHVNWGILTDGLQLKIIDFQDQNRGNYYWDDFDEIVLNENLDRFYSIYNMFSQIKSVPHKKSNKIIKQHTERTSNSKNSLRKEFYRQLHHKMNQRTKLFAKYKSDAYDWVGIGSGKSGIYYHFYVRRNNAQVDIYITDANKDYNKRVFNALMQHKDEIERDFGAPLDWRLNPNLVISQIIYLIPDGGWEDTEKWDELQEKLVDAMIRLEKAFRSYIRNL